MVLAVLAALTLLSAARPAREAPPPAPAADGNPIVRDSLVRDSLVRATDLLRVRHLDSARIAPDGRSIAYTVRRVVADSSGPGRARYRMEQHLHVVPTSGREPPRALTRAAAGASQPAWHPDSDWIAFVRPVDGTPQVFVLSLTGGEPVQLTDAPHGATNPAWSPGGNRLLFATQTPARALSRSAGRVPRAVRPGRSPQDTLRTLPPDTLVVLRDSTTLDPVDTLSVALGDSLRALSDSLGTLRDTVLQAASRQRLQPAADGDLLQVRKWLGRRSAETARVIRRLDFQGERGLQPDVSYRHYRVVTVPPSLFTGGTAPRPSRPVTRGARSFHDADWLPNGTQIVVSAAPATDRPPDRVRDRDLFLVDVRTSSVRRLLDLKHHALSDPRITPDGTTVAFRMQDLRTPGPVQHDLGLFALDGRTKPQLLTSDFDRDVSPPRWSPDGWYLYVTAPAEGGLPLFRLAPFGRSDTTDVPEPVPVAGDGASRDTFAIDSSMTRRVPREALTTTDRGIHAFDVTDASVAYVASDAANPSELYANTVGFSRERRLSRHNAAWLERRTLATPEPLTVASGTLSIDAWVLHPPARPDTARAPLLLAIRGGPPGLAGPAAPTTWHDGQYLAAQGYAVVVAAPRGSPGYGAAFRRLPNRNWGPGPAADVLAAADTAARRSGIDASQQVVMGGSYGGYLTAWIISQTDRFDAAVAERGAYDLPALLGSSAWRLLPRHFGGYPWDGPAPPAAGRPDSVVVSARSRASAPSSSTARSGTNRGTTSEAPSSTQAAADTGNTGAPSPADSLLSPREALLRNSPLPYAHAIRTPLLLLHGGADARTDASQSDRLYRTLAILDRPVEYVRYPGAGHNALRSASPLQRVDRIVRIHEFAARFVDPVAP